MMAKAEKSIESRRRVLGSKRQERWYQNYRKRTSIQKLKKKEPGAIPADTSVVRVHYKGTLIDGTEFDSSYKRGEPTEFPVNP